MSIEQISKPSGRRLFLFCAPQQKKMSNPRKPGSVRLQSKILLSMLGCLILATQGMFPFRGSSANTTSPQPPVRLRKNVESLPNDELLNLIHAINILKKRDPNPPCTRNARCCDTVPDPVLCKKSYSWWVSVHGFRQGPCEHGSDKIFPWHRAHLYYFEKLLQESDPDGTDPTPPANRKTADVTLPYWDWTTKPSGQHGYPKVYEDTSSPLFDSTRNQTGQVTVSPGDITDMLNNDREWADFGGVNGGGAGSLENGPHNYIHGSYVGGNMGSTTTAVLDVIFWAHHSNLDRIFAKWQEMHEPDACSGSPSQNMTCLDCEMRGMPVPTTVKMLLCTKTLGYEYDVLPTTEFALMDAAMPLSPQVIIAQRGTRVTLRFKVPTDPVDTVKLRLSDVAIPRNASYIARVYIHPTSERYRLGDRQFAQRYFARTFSIWKSGEDIVDQGHTEASHPKTASFTVDITRRVRQIAQTGAGKDWLVTVVFSPAEETRNAKIPQIGRDIKFGKAALIFKNSGSPKEVTLTPR